MKQLEGKISMAQQAIDSAISSRDNETKSSMGDKYETSRSLFQLEQAQNEGQLNKALKLKQDLSTIDSDHVHSIAQFGSLLHCNDGIYFLSIGLGRQTFGDSSYLIVSPHSPIGQCFLGKKAKDNFIFRDKTIEIQSIS